jgi:hypothetical protein
LGGFQHCHDMSAVYSYVKSYWSEEPEKSSEEGVNNHTKAVPDAATMQSTTATTTTTTAASNGNGNGTLNNGNGDMLVPHATETTSLLGETAVEAADDVIDANVDVLHPLPNESPSVHDFFFTPNNPTVQRYYRFSATPITPIVALHKKPGTGNSAIITSGVTGLLRRSAVVPSHGTDATGGWILVSVGGRSGWARKKLPEQHFSGFTLARTFAATEGWMGNHAFLCRGKIMLGSDAPSLFFTNVLLIVGYIFHFCIVLPKLRVIEFEHPTSFLWFLSTATIFWSSAVLGTLTVVTLWISAMMDPGILPPVSSPIKAPIPGDHVPLGGPLGYRYCSTCNIFRPPRSKHCNSCNVCVSKFDQYVNKQTTIHTDIQ